MDTFGVSKRILKELLSLTSDDYVRSFFTYEGCEQIENSNEFVIHGYLLPRYAPYKNGAYKIRIRIPENYPFTAPDIQLLTYIYHPAVSNDRSNPSFCKECCCNGWSSVMPLHHIIERLVLRIDQPELIDDYCVMNQQAKLDFDRNRSVFNENASKMIRKYATISVTLLNSPIKRQKLHHFTFE